MRVMDIGHCNLIGEFKFEPIAGSMAWTLRGWVRQDESHGYHVLQSDWSIRI